MPDGLDLLAADPAAILGRRHLIDFVRGAWRCVEPGTEFVCGRSVEAICNHLESVSRGEIRNLLINVPPGFSKSLLTEVFWPAWEWIERPATRWISVSFDAQLTLRDSRRMLAILQSDWYRRNYGDLIVAGDRRIAAGNVANCGGGWRFTTSVEGKMTGRHCDIMVVDDPLKPQDVSEATLASCKRWWTETVPSRFGNQSTGRRVIIMQRLHEEDLAGLVLREPGWEVLRLPMRYEPGAHCRTSIGQDWRTREGELLDPIRFPEDVVARMEREMGSRVAAAQLQQRPAPAAGAIFLRKWFKHYREPPARFDQYVQSWDCAFKDTDGSDFVCGQVWGVRGGEYYLLDQVHDRLDLPGTCEAILRMRRAWPKAVTILVEDKANGPAVIQTLGKRVSGLTAIEPEGGKLARANAVAPLYEAGNVWHPGPDRASWVDGTEEEMATFPFAAHDDRVDACSQALNYLYGKRTRYAEAMKRAGGLFT